MIAKDATWLCATLTQLLDKVEGYCSKSHDIISRSTRMCGATFLLYHWATIPRDLTMEIQSGWNQQRRLFPGVPGGHASRVSGAIVGQIFLSYGGGRNGLEPGSISMSVEEWMSVLKLSTLWAIGTMR